jgi:disulfide bond formation protein DsbB
MFLIQRVGMYTVMVIMTLYHLLKRKNAWSAHRVAIFYTIFMFCVTVGWYYSQTRIDEAQTIEFLAGPAVSSEIAVGDSCSALDNITDVLSIIQFWGNDLLMVRTCREHHSHHRLTGCFSCTERR